MRICAVVLGLAVGGFCCAAQAASLPLAQSGRALSEEPSVSSRATALADGESTTRNPHWIVYLPDFGLTRQPARIAHAYRVDSTRAVFFVQPSVPK